jgi:hypothetical protein
MTDQAKKILFGAIAAVAIILMGLVIWHQGSGSSADGPAPQTVTALCANEKCGFSGEVEMRNLVFAARGRPAIVPSVGPGYKCPKCGQNTLYTQPVKCGGCGTLFLPRQNESGAIVQTCPKCGKGQ